MNFLKKFLGSSPKGELAILPSGQLFLKRAPGSPKSSSECLYTDAVASIRETSAPHNYLLVIQRAFAEGEEQLKGDDDEEQDDDFDLPQDERLFLIDKSLHIYSFNRSGSLLVSWINKDGDEGETFEFVVDENIKSSEVDHFINTIHACCFERKYEKSSAGVTETQLKEFIYVPEIYTTDEFSTDFNGLTLQPTPSVQRNTKTETEKDDQEDEDDEDDSIYQDAEDETKPKTKVASAKAAVENVIHKVKGTGKSLFETTAELRLYDSITGVFALQSKEARISITSLGNFKYWLDIKTGEGLELGTDITTELNPVFDYSVFSFVFNYESDGNFLTWLLKFKSTDELDEFKSSYAKASWEYSNQSHWEKTEDTDRNYVLDAFNPLREDVLMNDYSDSEEEATDSEDEDESDKNTNLRTGLRKENFSDDEDEDDDQKLQTDYYKNSRNKNLTVSYTNDRSYVTNGNRIGVFKTNDEDELEFATAISNLNLDGKSFTPSKLMLHTQDRSLVMQGEKDKDKLYRMDLEYGKIVDEYKVKEDLPVVDFGPSKKFNQLTGEQTFLGISDKGLFKIDPRLSGDKLVESESKNYVTKNQFSSFGTTENGYIAVASDKGDIRLYDRLGIRAKSLIPAIGDPIRSIDISADGKWILATCDKYLLLIKGTIPEGKNAGSLAFLKSFGKDNSPDLKVLKISPTHVESMRQFTGSELKLTNARFNTGLGSKEQTIITSSGPYAITWSLKKILRGDEYPYLMRRHGSNVVADNFKFGTDKNVIIALEDDVGIVNKSAFRKANRESLAFKPSKKSF